MDQTVQQAGTTGTATTTATMGDVTPVDQVGAEALAAKVMAASADVAQQEAVFLRLLGEFDASSALRWWHDFATVAHWLSWACSITPGTAREHVRVARALRRMPQTATEYAKGELSYSKVRELTRLVDGHQEDDLLELARYATASQLARTVSAYRACPGTQKEREPRTRVSWSNRDDGCIQISAVLTPEQGAAVVAALEDATEEIRGATPAEGDAEPPRDQAERDTDVARRSRTEALVAIANHWLNTQPEDRSGEDRTTVVIEIDAAILAEQTTPTEPGAETGQPDHPATGPTSTPTQTASPLPISPRAHVPAGTCRVRGHGNLEPATARRMACEAGVHAVIKSLHGEPLAVGRTRRFGTRAQRRALMTRDRHCQFPACDRNRHLKVHHIVSWLDGGPTDLDNLILLCQHHHTAVHEGGITIIPTAGPVHWRFLRPDQTTIIPVIRGYGDGPVLPLLHDPNGRLLTGTARDQALAHREELIRAHEAHQLELAHRHTELQRAYRTIETTTDPRAARSCPIGGGEGFNLANCVEVLFASRHAADPDQQSVDLAA